MYVCMYVVSGPTMWTIVSSRMYVVCCMFVCMLYLYISIYVYVCVLYTLYNVDQIKAFQERHALDSEDVLNKFMGGHLILLRMREYFINDEILIRYE